LPLFRGESAPLDWAANAHVLSSSSSLVILSSIRSRGATFTIAPMSAFIGSAFTKMVQW
jgi:hypothetical protein